MPLSTSSPIKIERLKALTKLVFVGSRRFQLQTVPAFVIVSELPLTLNCSECPVIQDLKRDKLEPLISSNMELHALTLHVFISPVRQATILTKSWRYSHKYSSTNTRLLQSTKKYKKNSKVIVDASSLFGKN